MKQSNSQQKQSSQNCYSILQQALQTSMKQSNSQKDQKKYPVPFPKLNDKQNEGQTQLTQKQIDEQNRQLEYRQEREFFTFKIRSKEEKDQSPEPEKLSEKLQQQREEKQQQ